MDGPQDNLTHQSGPTELVDSIHVLLSTHESMMQSQSPPPEGWIKLNVDGSFVEATGDAGVGVIARNCKGEVLFTAWRVIFQCANAAEAEARACMEGVRLATQWAQGSVIIESDCARMVKALASNKEDRSDVCFVIAEATVTKGSITRPPGAHNRWAEGFRLA
ncbi:hypothetical protein HU200_002906 [Digitaria exilis]|uniref:RNase H type-1 domain-containing protein n=1 Tax=Digitaria exilis TaxID=1010633 RepID=A0A835FW42_9POAL|nr:hypothetical protein HU200_002906 [Digitaria exilis]